MASFHFKRNVQLTLQRREPQIQFNAHVHQEGQKAMLICLNPLTKAFSFISRFVRMASPVTTPTCVYVFPQRCILTGQKHKRVGRTSTRPCVSRLTGTSRVFICWLISTLRATGHYCCRLHHPKPSWHAKNERRGGCHLGARNKLEHV